MPWCCWPAAPGASTRWIETAASPRLNPLSMNQAARPGLSPAKASLSRSAGPCARSYSTRQPPYPDAPPMRWPNSPPKRRWTRTPRFSALPAPAATGGPTPAPRATQLSTTANSIATPPRCPPMDLKSRLDTKPNTAPPDPDPHFRPKFAECIPDHLLGLYAWQRLYDWDASDHVLHSPIISI